MTYAAFLATFIVPPILVVLGLYLFLRSRSTSPHIREWAVPATAAIALIYTTPWDNYLVYRGVWTYGADRVVAVIGYVPIEEYLFFVLQPILTGFFLLLLLMKRVPRTRTAWRPTGHAVLWAALSIVGWGLIAFGGPHALYAGLILGWAGPVVAGLWWYGGAHVRKLGWRIPVAIWTPTLYLWVCDRIAIALGIWNIPRTYSTGWHLLGLPVEEALFFLVTNILSVLGTLLFAHGPWIAPPPIVVRAMRLSVSGSEAAPK